MLLRTEVDIIVYGFVTTSDPFHITHSHLTPLLIWKIVISAALQSGPDTVFAYLGYESPHLGNRDAL